jgi:hypothetical protein
MTNDFDAHIPYEQYFLQHIAKAKKSGEQLTGRCPFHNDKKASFGVNLRTSECLCRAGCFEGNIISFHAKLKGMSTKEAYQDLCKTYNIPGKSDSKNGAGEKVIPLETLDLFTQLPEKLIKWMKDVRGWSQEVIEKYRIGYNHDIRFDPGFIGDQRITIPIFDVRGELVNIRSYKPKPAENEPKLTSWSKGNRKKGTYVSYGEARPWPLDIINRARTEGKILYLVEGEPDCLCGLSHDLLCFTQTAGANNWKDEWNLLLKGLWIRIIYDNDEAGRRGESEKGVGGMLRVIQHLPAFASKVECVQWPDWMEEKEDLTDWFMKYNKTVEDLDTLEWLSPDDFKKRYGKTGPGEEDEDPEEKAVRELNEKHAIVMLGGKCAILNEEIDIVFSRPDISFSSPHDIKTRYLNQKIWIQNGTGKSKQVSIANLWLQHEKRREYKQVVFAPGQDVQGCYNLYRGMAYEPKEGSWKLLRQHILNAICQGDKDIYKYILSWMADAVQNPGGERPGVSIVLRGPRGAGKGIVANTFGELFGHHYRHIEQQSQLVGKFNQHLKDALLVFADECFFAGDKQSESTIKRIITEKTIRIEPKGQESFEVRNFMRLWIASNEQWVIPAGEEERRFLMLDVKSPPSDKRTYFAPIWKEIANGGREAMLYDLLRIEYDADSLREAPRTDALLSQIEEGAPPEWKFWYHCLKRGTILNSTKEKWEIGPISSKQLYAEFVEFAKPLGKHFLPSPDSFGRKLRKYCPEIIRKKQKHFRYEWDHIRKMYAEIEDFAHTLQFASLQECRDKFANNLKQMVNWDEYESA